jgi:hypothetical protein
MPAQLFAFEDIFITTEKTMPLDQKSLPAVSVPVPKNCGILAEGRSHGIAALGVV